MAFPGIIVFSILSSITSFGQSKTEYNLAKLFKENKLTVVNREVTLDKDVSKNAIVQNEDFDEGLVWLNNVSFSTGTIEMDIKGQDVFQHSFVGIAFHGVNDTSFEAIYFRPFNFRTDDSTRKAHAVQYISLPDYPWQRLREQNNGQYEKLLNPAPDPDNWFHAKFVIKEKEALVYVNNATTPCLQIPLLKNSSKGKIGLYTADRSGGTFANLAIQNE
jgi:hypothetical protein